MADTKNEVKRDDTRRVFGLDSDTLISRLEKKRVRVVAMNGDELVGVLVGATPYTLTLLVGDEKIPTIVNKGAVFYVHPVVNGSNGTAG